MVAGLPFQRDPPRIHSSPLPRRILPRARSLGQMTPENPSASASPLSAPSLSAPRSARVLVSGGGIAGPATAYWLARAGHSVTLVERSAQWRQAGQNVDVRGPALEVLERMGIAQEVRAQGTGEVGTRIVDQGGHVIAEFPVDPDTGNGPTAEVEVLRSTLAEILHRRCTGLAHEHEGGQDAGEGADGRQAGGQQVQWRNGQSIQSLEQDEHAVHVTFADGRQEDYEVLVVAEGVGSRTRAQVFPEGIEEKRLDLCMAFATIPPAPRDDAWWRWCILPGSRQVSVRPDQLGTARALLSWVTGPVGRLGLPEARALLREKFSDAGWETPRVLEAVDSSADLYLDDLRQIRARTWHRGRVVLTGDAAWCATPISGRGASLSLTGAYVLGTGLGQALAEGGDLTAAFTGYEAWMRPEVEAEIGRAHV